MKYFRVLFIFILSSVSCNQAQKESYESFASVGEPFPTEEILSAEEMLEEYRQLRMGDTIAVRFKAEVAAVCKSKGCWMDLKLEDGQETSVKFRDYAFFVPKDIEDKEVVVNGKAFVSIVSVEDQRHYAEDAGKAPEEIAAITEPKTTLSFLADGVLIEP